ncbi:ubiquinol-cytochrome C chaperone family protein [Roseococcus sp. DSY-14]|uniref:ubiquinol-cytochrome C chaperone family protein n=1 Tax=Roseococcus sp. DSY-14 TaxID=3369650 RepID=UPI00387B838C
MGLASLFRRKPFERTGFLLYGRAVAAAREPAPFAEWGVPDTPAGRFEMVCLHAALLIRRLRAERTAEGDALAQAAFDAMFSDMDLNLREMGIGDLSVGKKVRNLWEGFHGRAEAYGAALEAGDAAALAGALARNVWAGGAPPPGGAEALAARALAAAQALAGQGLEQFKAGEARFA